MYMYQYRVVYKTRQEYLSIRKFIRDHGIFRSEYLHRPDITPRIFIGCAPKQSKGVFGFLYPEDALAASIARSNFTNLEAM